MKKIVKYTLRTIQICLIISLLLVVEIKSSTNLSKIENSNLNKSLDLNAMKMMSENIIQAENNNLVIEQSNNENIINTVSGKLTGYVYNCPTCSKKLACDSSIDLSNGNVYYKDAEFGDVRIVASSGKYPCGTIVRFKKDSISSEPVTAIVLDRGVSGNTLDLLVESVNIAKSTVGSSNISYNILRNGWASV